MSNFDSPKFNPINPGQGPSFSRLNPHAKIASIVLWILSPLTILVFGCCSFAFLAFGVLSESELNNIFQPQIAEMPEEQAQLIQQMLDMVFASQSYLPVIAVIIFVLTVVPAIINIILPFYIQKGSRKATITSLVLSILLALITGVLTLLSLASRDFSLIVLTTLVVGYVFVVVKLARSLKHEPQVETGTGMDDLDSEPWNRHL
ncbi:hypothetical protein JD969_18650 [Planctomycetota bacterium]|nr:hypothetical protein JD969_18650 [Planctomycetota bacterium]